MGLFPTKDAEFSTYFGNAVTYLNKPENLIRLIISPENMEALGDKKTAWDELYPKSKDDNSATKTVIEDKNILRSEIEELLRDIYADFPKSVLTTADRNTLRIKERKPASERTAIDTTPDIIIHAKSGVRMEIQNRVESDQNRPSRHPESDGVEYKYSISEGTAAAAKPPAETTDPVPGKSVAAVEVVTKFSTKARFIIKLTEDEAGKMLNIQTRWKNNVDDEKSGPWSEVISKRIIW